MEEAMKKFNEESDYIALPTDGEYVGGSFQLSSDVPSNGINYIPQEKTNLDARFQRLLKRDMHIALKGTSKSGKSWMRQQSINDANVVQCRLNMSTQDIYVEALANIGVKLIFKSTTESSIYGTVEATGEIGNTLLEKVASKKGITANLSTSTTERDLKYDVNNFKFIADIIIESERRLVIEDFHYLSVENRKQFAYDLKALWDYGCYVVIVGEWAQTNLLSYLNPDLSGRMEEFGLNNYLGQIDENRKNSFCTPDEEETVDLDL